MHICLTIGVLGNILTLCILLNKRLRRTSMAQYLAALTLFDSIYIISSFVNNIEIFYPTLLNWDQIKPYLNLIFYPFTDFSSHTSAFIILAFTFERYIAIAYPLLSLTWCRPSRSRKTIAGTIMFSFALTFPTFLENKIGYTTETIFVAERQNQTVNITRPILIEADFVTDTYRLIYFWTIAVMVQFIPLTLLIIFNSILMRYIHQSIKLKHLKQTNSVRIEKMNSKYEKRTMIEPNKTEYTKEKASDPMLKANSLAIKLNTNMKSSSIVTSASLNPSNNNNETNKSKQVDQTKSTILLIATVLLFLVCQLPSAFLLIYEAIFPVENVKNKFIVDLRLGLNNIANGLSAINASVNFLLYTCFSEKFRQTFQSVFLTKFTKNSKKLDQTRIK